MREEDHGAEVHFGDSLDAMRFDSPVLHALFDLWRGKRGADGIMRRADFDPADLPKALPHIFIMEADAAAARFRYRLVGSEIERHLGISLGGRYLDDYRTGETLCALTELFGTVARTGRPGFAITRFDTERFASVVYRRLVLPMAGPDATPDRPADLLLGGWIAQWSTRPDRSVA